MVDSFNFDGKNERNFEEMDVKLFQLILPSLFHIAFYKFYKAPA